MERKKSKNGYFFLQVMSLNRIMKKSLLKFFCHLSIF